MGYLGDGTFWTQAEVKELVIYARMRGVRLVPELEMSSHSKVVLRQLRHHFGAFFGAFLSSTAAAPAHTPPHAVLYLVPILIGCALVRAIRCFARFMHIFRRCSRWPRPAACSSATYLSRQCSTMIRPALPTPSSGSFWLRWPAFSSTRSSTLVRLTLGGDGGGDNGADPHAGGILAALGGDADCSFSGCGTLVGACGSASRRLTYWRLQAWTKRSATTATRRWMTRWTSGCAGCSPRRGGWHNYDRIWNHRSRIRPSSLPPCAHRGMGASGVGSTCQGLADANSAVRSDALSRNWGLRPLIPIHDLSVHDSSRCNAETVRALQHRVLGWAAGPALGAKLAVPRTLRPMVWHNAFTDCGDLGGCALPNAVPPATAGVPTAIVEVFAAAAIGTTRFTGPELLANVTASGYAAVMADAARLYLDTGSPDPTAYYKSLWDDIAFGLGTDKQRSLLLGGGMSLWSDPYCSGKVECGGWAYCPSGAPADSCVSDVGWMQDAKFDRAFVQSAGGLLFPRANVGAGAAASTSSRTISDASLGFQNLSHPTLHTLCDMFYLAPRGFTGIDFDPMLIWACDPMLCLFLGFCRRLLELRAGAGPGLGRGAVPEPGAGRQYGGARGDGPMRRGVHLLVRWALRQALHKTQRASWRRALTCCDLRVDSPPLHERRQMGHTREPRFVF